MAPEEQIVISEDRLIAAIADADISVLDELLHDDLEFIIPNGQTISKAMDIENYRSGRMIVQEMLISDRIIKSVAGVFIVSVTVQLKAKYDHQSIDGNYRYLRVWKFVDHSWKIIAGSCFQI